jgi:hypothetical protein
MTDPKQKRLDDVARALGNLQAAEGRMRHSVNRARDAAATWAEVGEALGVSRQAAQQRFGSE